MAQFDDETLVLFIEETMEHLDSIESDLLEIEQGGEAIDEELVARVFRAAHSIKGGSGFLGLDRIKELSHKIENVLDMIRNYQLVPTPAVVNVLLKSFDRLGELFENVENSNEAKIDEHVDMLKKIVTGALDDSEQEAIDQEREISVEENTPCFKINQFDLNQARRGGKDIYLLEIDLIHDVQRHGKTPLQIIKDLSDPGVILDTQIGMGRVGDLDSEEIATVIPMYVLYATVVEPDLLGTLFNLDSSKVTLLPKGQEDRQQGVTISKSDQTSDTRKVEAPETTAIETAETERAATVEPIKPRSVGKTSKTRPAPEKGVVKSESLRVSVTVLDRLMNRAGELVLARNELLQAISSKEENTIESAARRIDTVTSELQDAIILTRMQPVGSIFNKFTRIVRDLATDLGKKISLDISGNEVELDKSIIEGLGDPLTHLVRNSCDHGIETPEVRSGKDKPKEGRITLRALHESGQVIVEIEDDGKGLDANVLTAKAIDKGLITEQQAVAMSEKEKVELIMRPGFSTAAQVTDVSGRGVGMDVVKTNLDQLGGQVELISEVDKGATVRIKLPLTLAIIPSLLVEACNERFTLPQVNVRELLRIPAGEIRERIEKVGEADVLILRGELIPLLQLNNVLALTPTYYDPKEGIFRPDRRAVLADQRLASNERPREESSGKKDHDEEMAAERRTRRDSDAVIVVLQAGSLRFGLVVEKVHDTVEIVVKPLGRHFKTCEVYAGATIMGDGRVALILDVAGLGKLADLRSIDERTPPIQEQEELALADGAVRQTLLLFHNGPAEFCAVPLHQVLRLEQIETDAIRIRGGKKVIQYRDSNLPVYALEEVANVEMLEEQKQMKVVIFVVSGRNVGLLVTPPLDIIEQDIVVDEVTLKQPGISGSANINGETALLVDIFGFMKVLNPDWFDDRDATRIAAISAPGESAADPGVPAADKSIVLAEDSAFFRAQVKQFMESEGYRVLDFEDGKLAWEYLNANPDDVRLVVTDIEMPNMDGFELTQKIKRDDRLSHLSVIALTSLAGEADIARGKDVGIDDYQVKLDKEKLLQGIYNFLL